TRRPRAYDRHRDPWRRRLAGGGRTGWRGRGPVPTLYGCVTSGRFHSPSRDWAWLGPEFTSLLMGGTHSPPGWAASASSWSERSSGRCFNRAAGGNHDRGTGTTGSARKGGTTL